MSKIYLKPKPGEVVVWLLDDGRCYADTVSLVVSHGSRFPGSYLKTIYLRGGCAIDQRMIVAVLPPGTIIKQATFDNPHSYLGFIRDSDYRLNELHKKGLCIVPYEKRSKRGKSLVN